MTEDLVFGMTTIAAFVVVASFIILVLWAIPLRLWIEAISAGTRVGIGYLIGMRLRKVNPPAVVRPLIWATKAGLDLGLGDLEAHYLAGGMVDRVVRALISADKANIELGFQQAAAIDLAGRDVFEAVQVSVNPKVITTPRVAAMAKDGIQLIAMARVTVRANINRLVGGAGEETILARVGEGIVSTIGSSDSHKAVLENPDTISKTVLARGLDSGTAFEILSIDIADVDVGKNIGAELQTDQAEADKRVAQARAEERRAMAVALEQEMRAKVQEMRAQVVEAEAEVPRAREPWRARSVGVIWASWTTCGTGTSNPTPRCAPRSPVVTTTSVPSFPRRSPEDGPQWTKGSSSSYSSGSSSSRRSSTRRAAGGSGGGRWRRWSAGSGSKRRLRRRPIQRPALRPGEGNPRGAAPGRPPTPWCPTICGRF